MNNRFGFKDLINAVLLLAVLISVWLAMAQYDRQWTTVQQIQASLKDQSDQLRKIDQRLASGIAVNSGPSSSATQSEPASQSSAEDPFYRLKLAQKQPGYTPGGWLILYFTNSPGKLTPLVTNDYYSGTIQGYIFQSLAQRDLNTLKWRPLIAKSWHKSKDGLTFTFNLRHDVTFADGSPLTTADVVYTFNLIMNPQLADPAQKTYYQTIASVKAEGTYRVVFKLNKPYFKGFETCATMPILSKHFYSRYTAAQINERPALIMGTGPYCLQQGATGWTSGNGQIVLVRNNNYWGVPPAFDRVIYKIISDKTAQLTAFTNGELDMFSPNPEQYTQLKNRKSIRKRANIFVYATIVGGYRYIGWNERKDGKPTPFSDRRVRQAMTMLIDRQQMCDRLMEGLSRVVTGPFNPLSDQYNHKIKPWPYDPARAKKLLKEAGYYDRNGDGVIDGPKGKPFEFKLIYPSDHPNYQQMVLYLKDAYAKAGIIMHPDPLPFPVMIQRIQKRNFTAMTLGWGGTIVSDPYQIFDSKQIAQGGDDYVHYVNHKLDKLIETARITPDAAKRLKMWHKVARIIHQDQPYTFLFTTKAVDFINKRIHNVKLTKKLGLNDQSEWFIPKPQQTWEH